MQPAFDRVQHVADYSIHVEPGDPCTMGTLETKGLNDAQQAAVAKAWKMKQGDPFDATYMKGFLLANKDQLHAVAGYGATFKQIEHLDTHAVDLVISFVR